MKWWYEFWLTYYDEDTKDLICDHGLLNAETLSEAIEQITKYYGEDSIKKLEIQLVDGWEDSPWLFDKDCDPNCLRYWKADEQEKFE